LVFPSTFFLESKHHFFCDEKDWSGWMVQKAMGRLSGHGFSQLASITEKRCFLLETNLFLLPKNFSKFSLLKYFSSYFYLERNKILW